MISVEKDWDGGIEGIQKMRCDGFVEYSFEKQNIRVCGGKDDDYWNISGGEEGAENHEELHTYDPEKGELCPKIQAGETKVELDDGSFVKDTTFIPTDTNDRRINNHLIDIKISSVGEIKYEFDIPKSPTIFVQITVQKNVPFGPLDFIIGDDIANENEVYGPIGKMNFRELQKKECICWLGRTGDGRDFWGQDGSYAFLIIVMDKGGNYAQYASIVDIEWPKMTIPPNNRVSDEILFDEIHYPILNIKSMRYGRIKNFCEEGLTREYQYVDDTGKIYDLYALRFSWKVESQETITVRLDGTVCTNIEYNSVSYVIDTERNEGEKERTIYVPTFVNYPHELSIEINGYPGTKKIMIIEKPDLTRILVIFIGFLNRLSAYLIVFFKKF